MKYAKPILTLSLLLTLTACGDGMQFDDVVRKLTTEEPAKSANAVPAPRVAVSNEVITMSLISSGDLAAFRTLLSRERPDAAELRCAPSDALCAQAKAALEQAQIPAQFAAPDRSAPRVVLHYRRLVPVAAPAPAN